MKWLLTAIWASKNTGTPPCLLDERSMRGWRRGRRAILLHEIVIAFCRRGTILSRPFGGAVSSTGYWHLLSSMLSNSSMHRDVRSALMALIAKRQAEKERRLPATPVNWEAPKRRHYRGSMVRWTRTSTRLTSEGGFRWRIPKAQQAEDPFGSIREGKQKMENEYLFESIWKGLLQKTDTRDEELSSGGFLGKVSFLATCGQVLSQYRHIKRYLCCFRSAHQSRMN